MVKIFTAMKMLNSILVQNCNIYQKMWQKLFVDVCVHACMLSFTLSFFSVLFLSV
jgi:hypothetical protein